MSPGDEIAIADWSAVESAKADRIRSLLDRITADGWPEGTCTVRDAARVLPLVGWDVDLAVTYLSEERVARIHGPLHG